MPVFFMGVKCALSH